MALLDPQEESEIVVLMEPLERLEEEEFLDLLDLKE